MNFELVMQTGEGGERPFGLKPRTVIGRESRCDVRIPLPTVENHHCEIILDGSELRLTDLDSSEGTYHNGRRVEKSAVLSPEDTVRIGPVTFTVRARGGRDEAGDGDDGLVEDVEIIRHLPPTGTESRAAN